MSSQSLSKPSPKNAKTANFCIVGSGIIGKACALAMAQLGYSVIQIAPDLDQAISPPCAQYGQRIYAISPSSKALLEDLNVWGSLDHSRIQAVRDMRIFGDRREPGDQLHFSAFEAGRPELAWIIEADLIEATLDQAIRFHKQITNVNASVSDIQIKKDIKPTVLLDDGTPIESELIIAADGAKSPLRSAIGINAILDDYKQAAVVANFGCSHPHLETAYQWFLSNGDILAMLPLPNQQLSMVWSTSTENAQSLLQLKPEVWASTLLEQADGAVAKALGHLQMQSSPASFALRRIKAEGLIGPAYDPKVVLIGDAAHVMHPLAGQGLNLGLRDVSSLLQIMKSKESFRAIDDRVLLRRYERQRVGDTSSLLWLTDRLKKLFSASGPFEKQVRNWGLGLVNRSHLLKRQLIERALGDN